MSWNVKLTLKAQKQFRKLPQYVQSTLRLLVEDLKSEGPSTDKWPNYGKLKGQKGDKRHCDLIKGRPTYVCCWEVVDKAIHLLEVYYFGTHEKAPY